jgi:hypothetical protein
VAGIGIIRGHSIAKNKDGDKNRILLQVEMLEDDIRTVELMPGSGEDYNPAIGSRVFVADAEESSQIGIETTDNLEPETDLGEKEIYSTDNPVTKKLARLKLNSAGEIELNGNADNIVRWSELNTALQTLVTAINAFFETKKDDPGSAGALTLDLSLAKVDEVKTS